MRRAWIAIGLLLPATVLALEYRDLSKMYTDAPFPAGEAAGISLLTGIGAVQGNPDGSFSPKRTLNRAEFLKIALASHPRIRVSASDAENCFPDVPKDAWFSSYVCLAKRRGMVSGYPDGEFKPARPVNYAEALKILGELYEYVAYSGEDEEWYMGYVRAAQFNKTILPIALEYDRPLTRGQMARLAAAYRAKEEGELELYRMAEVDLEKVIAMQRSSSSRSSPSSSASSTSSISSISSRATAIFPALSHLIPLGESAIIADAFFPGEDKSFVVRNITVEFKTEPKNLASLEVVTEHGDVLAVLDHDTYDKTDRTYKAQGEAVNAKIFPSNGAKLGLKLTSKTRENGGFAAELLQVRSMEIVISPADTQTESKQVVASQPNYPPHQTVQSKITEVRNLLPPSSGIETGSGMTIAEFEVRGTLLENALLHLEQVFFTIAESRGVTLDHFQLQMSDISSIVNCTQNGQIVECTDIPPASKNQSQITVRLLANVRQNLSIEDRVFRIDLGDPGFLSTMSGENRTGPFVWSDGTGTYRWVDLGNPVAKGTEWK